MLFNFYKLVIFILYFKEEQIANEREGVKILSYYNCE